MRHLLIGYINRAPYIDYIALSIIPSWVEYNIPYWLLPTHRWAQLDSHLERSRLAFALHLRLQLRDLDKSMRESSTASNIAIANISLGVLRILLGNLI